MKIACLSVILSLRINFCEKCAIVKILSSKHKRKCERNALFRVAKSRLLHQDDRINDRIND